MKMSIVISFCFCYPLGSGVISSVYHVPYQPRAFGKLHTRSQLRFLRFVLGAERKDPNHLLVFVSVGQKRDLTLFLSVMALMQSH